MNDDREAGYIAELIGLGDQRPTDSDGRAGASARELDAMHGSRPDLINRREHLEARKEDAEVQAASRGGRSTHPKADQVDETASSAKARSSIVRVCAASAIGEGRAASVLVRGAEVVVWRDADGRLCAADSVCPHRGASLVGGAVIGGQLTCPVHGWRFDGSGRNVYRPDGQPLASMRLRCYPVLEDENVVYLELHTGGGRP